MAYRKIIALLSASLFIILLLSVARDSFFSPVEPSKHIYFEIVFLLLLAVVGELAVAYVGMPSVMILLVLGMLISPSFLSLIWGWLAAFGIPHPAIQPDILRFTDVIHVFAQLGAVILLFKVGLHNRIEGIFSKENVLVAAAGVVLPFLAGYAYAVLSGGGFAYSMFVGAALTATSVGVTVAILKEYGLLEDRFARIIIGAAVIDDVLGLLVLSFVINVSAGGSSLLPLATTGISALIFLLGSIFAGDYFVRYLDRKDMSPRRFMAVLAFMLLYAYVAEFISLSAIVGAFMAGVILNKSRHHAEIEDKTYGLEILFMPIFFISLGVLVDVNALAAFAVPIVILTLIAVATKIAACGGASLLSKLKPQEALAVGVGMAPRGEVALIVASLGLSTGVLDAPEYSVISAMALLTTLVVPPVLNRVLKK